MDVCRLCLSKSPDKDIYQLKTSKKDGDKRYQEILPFCLDIEVTEEVQITKKMCTKCFKKVLTFYKFKFMALKNDAYLRSTIAKVLVKREPVDLDEDEVYLSQIPLEDTLELESVQNNMKFESDHIEIDFKPESPYVDDHINHSHDYEQDLNDDKHEIKTKMLKEDLNELVMNQTSTLKNIKPGKGKVKAESKISSTKPDKSQLYPCELCDKVFKCYGGKYKHTKFFHLKIKSHCNICNKDVVDLKHHTLSIHEQHKMKHECAACNRRFITITALNNHTCKPDELTCSRCKTKFEDYTQLLVHTRTVHEEERRFLCDYCNNGFFHKGNLTRHIQNIHTPNTSNKKPEKTKPIIRRKRHKYNINLKGYPCDVCSKVLSSVRGKTKHMQYVHMGLRKQCTLCDKRVIDLKQHMRSIHCDQSELPYKCELCSRRFDRVHRLRDHDCERATDVPQYDCPERECDRKFRLQSNLRIHIRKIHKGEKNYMCHFCSKSFFRKWRLIRHLRSHTKEKPFSCKVCNRAFSSEATLKNHMYIHENEAKFQCRVCHKRFIAPGYLSNHMVVHRSEKKHPCQYCGVRFVRTDHRKRHEYTAHEKYNSIAPEPN